MSVYDFSVEVDRSTMRGRITIKRTTGWWLFKDVRTTRAAVKLLKNGYWVIDDGSEGGRHLHEDSITLPICSSLSHALDRAAGLKKDPWEVVEELPRVEVKKR